MNLDFEKVLGDPTPESDPERRQVRQEELETQKVDPKDVVLPKVTYTRRHVPDVKVPDVEPPTNDRMGRRLAGAEKQRLWEMKQKFLRTVAVTESLVAVNVHAVTQMDRARELMMDNLYGNRRREAGNELMATFTAQCLQLTQSEILAVTESYLKRISEDL